VSATHDHVVPFGLAKGDGETGSKSGSVGQGKQVAAATTSGSKSAGSERPDDSGTPSRPGGSTGAGGGRKGGGGDEDPSDQSDHDENDASEDDDEEEEESDEDINVDGEVEAADGEPEVGSSNPGSPSAEGNHWHSYEALMNDTYPAKSKTLYLEAYSNFEQFLKREKQFVPNVVPTELSLLNYFSYLRKTKKWVATTLWSQYSRLNAVMKRKFGKSLNSIPNLTDLLKSYSASHRLKKSSVFTPQQASLITLYYLVN
jgi:hypothetical protein